MSCICLFKYRHSLNKSFNLRMKHFYIYQESLRVNLEDCSGGKELQSAIKPLLFIFVFLLFFSVFSTTEAREKCYSTGIRADDILASAWLVDRICCDVDKLIADEIRFCYVKARAVLTLAGFNTEKKKK